MNGWLEREYPLLGEDGVGRLKRTHVAIVGLGGVGGYVAEALCRAGVGRLTLIDGDVYAESNLNRQIGAETATLGLQKAAVTAGRMKRINPECAAEAYAETLDAGNCARLIGTPSFVCDCCDDTDAKTEIALYCAENRVPLISCMGTGNRLRPEKVRIADISKTSVCPLARSMRKRLKEKGINHLTVVFSDEVPAVRAVPPASVSFVPGTAGLVMAGHVIRAITGKDAN